ncbi:putative L,D-transpeptidase YkuD [compost metagenome]
MNNSVYLKKYVENHPDNKMAWYLLGKEYEASGQEGKANYCYNQASGVYEAFEASKVPADVMKEYQTRLLMESHRREKQSRLARRIGLALALLMLLCIPYTYAPGQTSYDADTTIADLNREGKAVFEDDASSSKTLKPIFTAREYAGGGKGMKSVADLLGGDSEGNRQTVVLGMKKSGDWLIWQKDLPVVYGIDYRSDSGETTIQSFDAKACDCSPPDASDLQKAAGKWSVRQESLAVLASSMRHYKEQTGSWPSSMKDLAKPFPSNWLAGSNNIMKDYFTPVLSELKQGNLDGDAGAQKHNGSAESEKTSLQAGEPFFTQPLEVLVDKKNHRLAVVSGSVILRNYKVGLGGEGTPEGEFVISDKVINPNGRSNGEFGSRGMQLSDTNYAIHGTNEPDSVGRDESLGCIRMLKEDVEELFDLLPRGTKVTIGKGIVPTLEVVPKSRFALADRQNQTNPNRTYHWLD